MSDNEAAFRAAYAEKLADAIARHPEDYAYGPDKIPSVVDKMVPALARGDAHVGSAAKAAARACGAKPTVAGIHAFLTGAA